MTLPKTHGYTQCEGFDSGGRYVEWYADDDGGTGYGQQPLMQRWYITPSCPPPNTPPSNGWHKPQFSDGPDRTDPGYWLDAH